MLVRLDQISGVDRSFSNHSGTLLKVELDGNVPAAVDAIENELKTAGRKPQLLSEPDYKAALSDETWRSASGVRILSLIEYGTFAARWLKQPLVFITVLALGAYFVRRRFSKTAEVKSTVEDSGLA